MPTKNSYERLVGHIFLKDFDTFFNNYKSKNALANKVLLAVDNFISTLNEFFNLYDGLIEEMVRETKISWYSYTNIYQVAIILANFSFSNHFFS